MRKPWIQRKRRTESNVCNNEARAFVLFYLSVRICVHSSVLPVFGDISVFVHIDVPIGGYELRLYGNVFCNAYHDPHTDNEAYGGGK